MEAVERKNLLIICPFALPNLGGVESHLAKLIRYAYKKNYFTTLITYQPLTRTVVAPDHEKNEMSEIFRIKWFGNGWFTKLEKYFPLVFLYLTPGLLVGSLIYYLKNKSKIDVIHAHGFVSALIVRILLLFRKKRAVVSTHAVYDFKNRPLLAFLIKNILMGFDKILAVSEISKNELVLIGIPAEKLSVHPNWIETEVFTPVANRNRGSFEYNLLFVGRLIEKKGIRVFVDIASKYENVGFHVVGSGPEENYVSFLAAKNKNIIYHGVLMQDNQDDLLKLLSLYQNCDFLVSPYTYDEGFSTTLLESLASGTPLILTRRGSPPTFITDQVGIFLSENPTAIELGKIIENIFYTKLVKIPSPQICRDYAVRNFGYQNADIIIKSYE